SPPAASSQGRVEARSSGIENVRTYSRVYWEDPEEVELGELFPRDGSPIKMSSFDGGAPIRNSFEPMPSNFSSQAASPQKAPSTIYMLDIRDVHDMGGKKSSVTFRDRSTGEVMKKFDLPPGNSKIVASLPPGDYSIEAESGERPQGSSNP